MPKEQIIKLQLKLLTTSSLENSLKDQIISMEAIQRQRKAAVKARSQKFISNLASFHCNELETVDASFDSNSHIFNSKENEKTLERSNNSNYRYGTIMNIAEVIAAVAVLTVTIIKKKSSQEEKADNINDIVIELNADEL